MNISNNYWYFTSAIPHKICDDIIKYGLSKSETMGLTGNRGNKKLSKDEHANVDIEKMKRK